jgi:hypothetical protein
MGKMKILKADSVFLKRSGKGTGVFYGGPVRFVDDPEALWNDPLAFRAVLQDTLSKFGGTADLTPRPDEIARARINNETYALKHGEILKMRKAKRRK